jgi:hypothetical protein
MKFRRLAPGDVADHVWWNCPGCGEPHYVPTAGPKAWGFNGDMERPTLTPSVLVYPGHRLNDAGERVETPRCHVFIRGGRIEFLSDSTHALAGQTIDVPEVT